MYLVNYSKLSCTQERVHACLSHAERERERIVKPCAFVLWNIQKKMKSCLGSFCSVSPPLNMYALCNCSLDGGEMCSCHMEISGCLWVVKHRREKEFRLKGKISDDNIIYFPPQSTASSDCCTFYYTGRFLLETWHKKAIFLLPFVWYGPMLCAKVFELWVF